MFGLQHESFGAALRIVQALRTPEGAGSGVAVIQAVVNGARDGVIGRLGTGVGQAEICPRGFKAERRRAAPQDRLSAAFHCVFSSGRVEVGTAERQALRCLADDAVVQFAAVVAGHVVLVRKGSQRTDADILGQFHAVACSHAPACAGTGLFIARAVIGRERTGLRVAQCPRGEAFLFLLVGVAPVPCGHGGDRQRLMGFSDAEGAVQAASGPAPIRHAAVAAGEHVAPRDLIVVSDPRARGQHRLFRDPLQPDVHGATTGVALLVRHEGLVDMQALDHRGGELVELHGAFVGVGGGEADTVELRADIAIRQAAHHGIFAVLDGGA